MRKGIGRRKNTMYRATKKSADSGFQKTLIKTHKKTINKTLKTLVVEALMKIHMTNSCENCVTTQMKNGKFSSKII